MEKSDRGLKHDCPECMTKYYDLKKEVITCPKCGAKPLAAKLPKAAKRAGTTSRATFKQNSTRAYSAIVR